MLTISLRHNLKFVSATILLRNLIQRHKKRKDSLETRAEQVFFSPYVDFLKLLEPSSRKPAWSTNNETAGNSSSLKTNDDLNVLR